MRTTSMRTAHRALRFVGITAVTAPLMLASMSASAGKTQVEYSGTGFPSSAFGPAGDAWVISSSACGALSGAASCAVAFTNGTSTDLIGLGFNAKIGSELYDSVFMNSSGFLTFTKSASPDQPYTDSYSSAITSVADIAGAVGSPFIAPSYADLGINNLVGQLFTSSEGGAYSFRGSAIPDFDSSSSTAADLVPAFAATWIGLPPAFGSPAPQVATQLVLYANGISGDFDLRLRYGISGNESYPGAVSGFSLGGSVETVSNPTGFADYFYSFVGGALDSGGGGGGGTISVPEIDPASAASGLTLLLGTMAVLCGRRRYPRQLTALRA